MHLAARPPSAAFAPRAAGPARTLHRPRLSLRASKGFGSNSNSSSPSKPPAPPAKSDGDGGGKRAAAAPRRQTTPDPEVQRAATLLLTALVAETDLSKRAKIAADNVDWIDGVFFAVADAYVKIARSEEAKGGGGGGDVVAGLEAAVRCALDAKQATLRPEIRLLNQLLDAPSLEARRAVLEAGGGAGASLLRAQASRAYLQSLLETFERDVAGQAAAAQSRGGGGGQETPAVAALKRAIEETRAIVMAAAAAAAA
jgi:hypothetical protein